MAEYKISRGGELLPGLLNDDNGVAKLVEPVLNHVLEAKLMRRVTQFLTPCWWPKWVLESPLGRVI